MVDLIIDGTSTTLYGTQNYGNVEIRNGGILYVQAYNGTAGTGSLNLIATSILVDATSQINADYRGYRGEQTTSGYGEGPGAGYGAGWSGSGAGYGGAGGGFYSPPGPVYGTLSGTDIDLGSGGGCGVYYSSYGRGGNGGGSIKLTAKTITINGIVTSNGEGGTTGSGQHGSGGGSGGGILIDGGNVTISGILRTNGGNGSNASGTPRYGGDGGGGGRIKVFYGTINTTGSTITANGGSGGAGINGPSGLSGSIGTTYSIATKSILDISSTPTGAEVWIAPTGSPVQDQNVQTHTILYVSPGSYDVALGLTHYQLWTTYNQSYAVAGNTYYISATLTPLPQGLSISSTPSGAEIYLALSPGTPVDQGVTTILGGRVFSNLAIGTYNILLRLAGYQDWIGTATVTSDTTTTVSTTLTGSLVTATNMTLDKTSCLGPCTATAIITWNNPGSTASFEPAIVVDTVRTGSGYTIVMISGQTHTRSFSIPLGVGSHNICPDPN